MKIVFVPAPSGKPWNGATLYNEPLGGSEAAVAYMARSLARLGHHVTVHSHGTGGVFDNVLYQSYSQGIVVRPDTDVVVVSRWLDVLPHLPEGNYKRILWIHDMPPVQSYTNIPVHAVFAISEFQARAWNLAGHGIYITSDGVDLDVFAAGTPQIDPTKLVWLSNPDRGLPVAARIFQEIRRRWPDLQLHVYGRSAVYGWDSDTERVFLPHEDFMENVVLHDPLPRQALAREIRDAWAMFYPTYWPETFCMAAMEAQALGIPVVCSNVGALPETVKGGIVGNDFLNAISQLRNPGRWSKLSQAGVAHAANYSWDAIAAGWVQIFEEMIK